MIKLVVLAKNALTPYLIAAELDILRLGFRSGALYVKGAVAPIRKKADDLSWQWDIQSMCVAYKWEP